MAVEIRDAISGRYILYATEAAHSADCNRYPFELLPHRIFLDTSVVNVLVKHAAQVFENAPSDPSMEPVLAEDVESLMHVFAAGTRATWDLVSSRAMVDELAKTRSAEDREALLDYGIDLAEIAAEDNDAWLRDDFVRRLRASSLLKVLPDEGDRHLLAQSIAMRCDAFCTRDRATIVSKRHRLPRMAVRVLTPREWWAHLRPWLGLYL